MTLSAIIEFLQGNWINIALIFVGTSALITYILQERRKVSEAALLVVLQIDEIQERIKEIQSFIVNGQLNETSFYESQTIFDVNYWDSYKHYFVREMEFKSFRTLNELYYCATEIQEQQQLMKNLQKNSFFVTQQVLSSLETNYISYGLNNSIKYPVDIQQVVSGLTQTMPQNLDSTQKSAMENLLHQFASSNQDVDFATFWKNYERNRSNVRTIINQNGLTSYIPLQIRLSLEKEIAKYVLLEISGCEGYKRLKEISQRKF